MAEIPYDVIAKSYNALHGREQEQKYKAILNIAKPLLEKTINMLDIGCGTGLASKYFKNIYNQYVGIDNSYEMLALAVTNSNSDKTLFTLASAEELPFKNKAFNFIICVTAMHNFANPRKALKEMLRVATSNAIIAITILKKSGKAKQLLNLCKKELKIIKMLEQEKDFIIIARKNQ